MKLSSGWWTSFFSGVVFDLQCQFRGRDETVEEADWLERHLRLQPGSRVLDVPCGDGRLALEFSSRGHQAVGLDHGEEILEVARGAAEERGLEASWLQGDMREPPLAPGEEEDLFAGAFNFGNSFGYFGEAGDLAHLEAVARVLSPGARFVVESRLAAETVLPDFVERDWRTFGEVHLLIHQQVDPARGELIADYTFVRGSTSETRRARYRLYTYREILDLFRRAGFVDLETYGSLDDEPFELGSPGLWVVGTAGGTPTRSTSAAKRGSSRKRS